MGNCINYLFTVLLKICIWSTKFHYLANHSFVLFPSRIAKLHLREHKITTEPVFFSSGTKSFPCLFRWISKTEISMATRSHLELVAAAKHSHEKVHQSGIWRQDILQHNHQPCTSELMVLSSSSITGILLALISGTLIRLTLSQKCPEADVQYYITCNKKVWNSQFPQW